MSTTISGYRNATCSLNTIKVKKAKGFKSEISRLYEPTPDDLLVGPDQWDVVLYDKDRGIKLRMVHKESLHPVELIDSFRYAGIEEGLDPDTIQGTAKQKSSGWVISWTAEGGTVKDLEKKTGQKISVKGGF